MIVIAGLSLLAVGLVYELSVERRLIKVLLVILSGSWLAAGLILSDWRAVGIGLILSLSHGRLIAGRYGPKRTKRIVRRTWRLTLILALAAGGVSWLADNRLGWLLSIAGGAWLGLCFRALWLSLQRTLGARFRVTAGVKSEVLPTVTLAIPARNETPVLTDCLRAALASSYGKLEVLVLDDCSQDSTPDIIRSFAHDGVRFIQGARPAAGWVGKNQAYDYLLREASGDLIIFAGVDTRLQPHSVDLLIADMLASRAKLLSIMPTRRQMDWWPSLVRPLRYYYQLAFASWPFMNSLWVVDRQWLIDKGGFGAYRHAILPEKQLARLARQEQAYRFRISSKELGISSRKRVNSLLETAIRTLYPEAGKEPLLALGRSAGWLLLAGILTAGWRLGMPVFLIGSILLSLSYFVSEAALQPSRWYLSGWLLPFAFLSQSLLELVSMVRYEYGRVDWKGRNVCLPVMKQRPSGAVSPRSNRQPT